MTSTPTRPWPNRGHGLRALTPAPGAQHAAPPDADEASYDATPLRPLLTMIVAGQQVRERLSDIACPTLLITSRQDHVVNPEDSDVLAREGTNVRRVITTEVSVPEQAEIVMTLLHRRAPHRV